MPDIDVNIAVDEAFVEKLRKLFRLEPRDLELNRQNGDRILPSVEQLIDGLFSHILSFPELAAILRDEQSQQKMRAGERAYLAKLLSGSIDEEYVQGRLKVGVSHEEIGIEPSGYLACFAYYVERIFQGILTETPDLPKDQLLGMCQALAKIILLDTALAWEAYYHKREQRIKDGYKALEIDHNLAIGMIQQRDKEIEELLKTREDMVIIKRLEVGLYMANCYIVGSEVAKEGMIIDPGAEAEQILSIVKGLGIDIKFIVLTHGHIDHIGVVREIRETTGAEVAIHADDADFLREQALTTMFGASSPALSSPTKLLKDGDSIDIGDLHFLVLHTPGHTPGGICLLGQGVVFTGDTLFNYSVGRTDLPRGSHSQLLNGIHTKIMTLPDNTVVYPGHGPESTIGAERRGNPFLRG